MKESTDSAPRANEASRGFNLEIRQTEALVAFEEGSEAHPNNWVFSKKMLVVITALFNVLNSGISSSLPSNAVPYIFKDFDIQNSQEKCLPTSIFLIGFIIGPVIWSPLSETIGRRPVLLWTFTVFVFGTLACALAPSWGTLLFFRLVCGMMAAAPQTVIGGVYADLFFDLRSRGRAMAFYMSTASFGPILGPIISGFASLHGWRWTFWISLILAGTCWIALFFMPETFVPAILNNEIKRLRSSTTSEISPSYSYSSYQGAVKHDWLAIFSRPLGMLATEPIVIFSSLYVSLAYGLNFFFFQAFPIIFEGTYNFSTQLSSLTFIPVGLGALCSGLFTLYYEHIFQTAKKRGKSWTTKTEFQRLPMACVGGPCITISLFWLGWSANKAVPWIVPVLPGLFFGFGYQIIFISLLTYVTDAYKIYSASALASSTILRSIFGALLPLAAAPMYDKLGNGWATSILGFFSIFCLPIPFVLIYAGPWIRKRSKFCCQLLEQDEISAANVPESGNLSAKSA
ncbi:hypothetical protein N7466_000295 [Penicillium verhagenii]|uniref:uncharacterized protein n=1 Tax=Penicillium verhagenii TaxID=1562060 RepID=UPI002545B245|nr:uncharacterized protein N7466_000295 [Penicillium verhagenii]KAJ5947280.1 hypothetical protein N7466_000295 [Penicillium verhagenii]